ncbi:MAG: hypothetical protein EBQ56_01385 [Proteobacteria bacterium]|nr:hypothetical protein [Actinomycetota bacterium]NBT04574.1 hypothetical protein [Pseudomonadota bacterium]NBT19859.1 hypothetical protein [Pseudomonadota bacterium]NBT25312.1 hypothetical protein [Actinomycetota bacterium]NBY46431.1 hypothetical protein [Pseudomonadota bacterium]
MVQGEFLHVVWELPSIEGATLTDEATFQTYCKHLFAWLSGVFTTTTADFAVRQLLPTAP